MQLTCHYDSPLGGILLASDGEALTGLWFDGQKYFADTLKVDRANRVRAGDGPAGADGSDSGSDSPAFDDARRWLDVYFSGRDPGFTPALHMLTTPFRRAVWEVMLAIPYGSTMTYGEIAAEVARRRGLARMSAQAVGGAVGHNSISLIIPCHRVVGSDGSLTGYAGGVDKKLRLLTMEGADMSRLFVPTKGTAL